MTVTYLPATGQVHDEATRENFEWIESHYLTDATVAAGDVVGPFSALSVQQILGVPGATYVSGARGVNLAPNPNYEYDTVGVAPAGWSAAGAAIVADSTHVQVGTKAMKVTPSSNGATAYFNATTAPGLPYALGAWIYSPSGDPFSLALTDNIDQSFAVFPVILANTWTFVSVGGTTDSHAARQLVIINERAGTGGVFWVDAVQLHQASSLPVYFDGDTANCSWTGVRGNSPSVASPGFVDSAGQSTYIQTAGLAKKQLALDAGSFTATWAGGVVFSNAVTVGHNLGRVPIWVGISVLQLPGGFNAYGTYTAISATQLTNVQGITTQGNPGAGTQSTIYWAALG